MREMNIIALSKISDSKNLNCEYVSVYIIMQIFYENSAWEKRVISVDGIKSGKFS